jgi:hypothetical protein
MLSINIIRRIVIPLHRLIIIWCSSHLIEVFRPLFRSVLTQLDDWKCILRSTHVGWRIEISDGGNFQLFLFFLLLLVKICARLLLLFLESAVICVFFIFSNILEKPFDISKVFLLLGYLFVLRLIEIIDWTPIEHYSTIKETFLLFLFLDRRFDLFNGLIIISIPPQESFDFIFFFLFLFKFHLVLCFHFLCQCRIPIAFYSE